MSILFSAEHKSTNIYYSMFLLDSSCILLVDGYLTFGKILYATQNFSSLFMYNNKELINITIDDLLPNCIQVFHKELVDDAIKYSNLNYIYKRPKDSFIRNKNGGFLGISLKYFKKLSLDRKNINFIDFL